MDPLVATYLVRLGIEAESPSVAALFRLHGAHVERVPYETLWIQLGQPWGIDPIASATRIATEGRGGYCFHLNGAFMYLLQRLGYKVAAHVGGVHGPLGPDEHELTNHLVLSISDLPCADNPAGVGTSTSDSATRFTHHWRSRQKNINRDHFTLPSRRRPVGSVIGI